MWQAAFQPCCLANKSVDGHEMFCPSEIWSSGDELALSPQNKFFKKSLFFFSSRCTIFYSATSVAILEAPQNENRCGPKLKSGWLKNLILLFVTWVWQHADFKCWVQGNARHRPSVSLKRYKSSSASFGCCFPRGASQIVTAEQRGLSPRGEPKYPGNQASFSLWEPFSIPDTPHCLLFPLSSSPPILSASEHYKHSVSSLWFHPNWSPSFHLQPAHLPEPRIDPFLIFFCAVLDNDTLPNTTRLLMIDFYSWLRWVGQIFFVD